MRMGYIVNYDDCFCLCEGGNSNNEEGFDVPPSSSSDESASDEEEEADTDASEGTLNNIISKLNSAGIMLTS